MSKKTKNEAIDELADALKKIIGEADLNENEIREILKSIKEDQSWKTNEGLSL